MDYFLNKFLLWFKNWDFMTILYQIIAALIASILLYWAGVFRFLSRQYKIRKGIRAYKKKLLEDCSTLIVVGRRHGFSIKDVFVELDTAPSDLMNKSDEKHAHRNYVLVGGPGAGKSTIVKHLIIEHLSGPSNVIPFFIRLREYVQHESIEDFIISKLKVFNIEDAKTYVKSSLQKRECLCVLDGLDEVRPHLRSQVYDHINRFYQEYFSAPDDGKLIVTCRKEAYRTIPLDIPWVSEVRPLTDQQIQRFAKGWPLGFPHGKSCDTFWRDLASTERILELARSPLLLVGALMQYTESNLGIPDEKVEYLSRIGRWLVFDWATAQGHPSDPWRPAYQRVLSRLALNMHTAQEFEYTTEKSVNLIKGWLPDYGYESELAETFLQNIMTGTGILVRNAPGSVVFSQYSLQEYYASIDAISQLGPQGLANKASEQWWREVILLAVSQEKNPTQCLDALFASSPTMGALAVAECPTPSIDMQVRAIQSCLFAFDKGEEEAGAATVSLLRKVKGDQEGFLCDELEKRLKSTNGEIASSVGVSLAIAGTTAASKVLARHSEIWSKCLEKAGYLSITFENLLVDWIKNGTDDQSNHAVDLLCSRLSTDRLNELVGLLPSLKKTNADYLARNLLFTINQNLSHRGPFSNKEILAVSKCVPFINDREGCFSLLTKREGHPLMDLSNLIKTTILISRSKPDTDSIGIFRLISNSWNWSNYSGTLITGIASSLIFLAPMISDAKYALSIVAASILLYLICTVSPYSSLAWIERRYSFRGNINLVPVLTIIVGLLVVFAIGAILPPARNIRILPLIGISLCYMISSYLFVSMRIWWFGEISSRVVNITRAIWTLLLVVALIVYWLIPSLPLAWIFVFSLFNILWTLSLCIVYFLSWRRIKTFSNLLSNNTGTK